MTDYMTFEEYLLREHKVVFVNPETENRVRLLDVFTRKDLKNFRSGHTTIENQGSLFDLAGMAPSYIGRPILELKEEIERSESGTGEGAHYRSLEATTAWEDIDVYVGAAKSMMKNVLVKPKWRVGKANRDKFVRCEVRNVGSERVPQAFVLRSILGVMTEANRLRPPRIWVRRSDRRADYHWRAEPHWRTQHYWAAQRYLRALAGDREMWVVSEILYANELVIHSARNSTTVPSMESTGSPSAPACKVSAIEAPEAKFVFGFRAFHVVVRGGGGGAIWSDIGPRLLKVKTQLKPTTNRVPGDKKVQSKIFKSAHSLPSNASPGDNVDDCHDQAFLDKERLRDAQMEEIREIGISEESPLHAPQKMKEIDISVATLIHGAEEQTILWCRFEEENIFEFYFKHARDMANIVGVGLDYAKVRLVNGCEVQVWEIFEADWKLAWKNGELNSGTMSELMKLKTSCLPHQTLEDAGACFGKDQAFQSCIVQKLANYFASTMSKEIPSGDHMSNVGVNMSSGGVQKSADSSLVLENSSGIANVTPNIGENTEVGNSSRNFGLTDADTFVTVSVVLLPGGKVEPDLPEFDDTIGSKMEFTFRKDRSKGKETPKIRIRFEKISFGFNRDEDCMATAQKRDWIHTEMKVKFGLSEAYRNHGDLAYGTLQQLDVALGKEITNVSRGHVSVKGKEKGGAIELRGEGSLHIFKATAVGRFEGKQTSSHGENQQHSQSREVGLNHTPGGLRCDQRENWKRSEVVCDYLVLGDKQQSIEDFTPWNLEQTVKFEATWIPQEHSLQMVEYVLTVKRSLEKKLKAPKNLKGTKPKKRRGIVRALFRGKKKETETQATEGLNKRLQVYSKKMWVNHAMTHLCAESYELKERQRGNNTTYLSAVDSNKEFVHWTDGVIRVATHHDEASSSEPQAGNRAIPTRSS